MGELEAQGGGDMTYDKLRQANDLDNKIIDYEHVKRVLTGDKPMIQVAIQMIEKLQSYNFETKAEDADAIRLKEVIKKAAEQILAYVEETIAETRKQFDEL